MAKRLTKEQREANEIEELRKQIASIYIGACPDDWLADEPDGCLSPSTLEDVLRGIQKAFSIDDDHFVLKFWCLRYFECPQHAAEFLHRNGVRAWTKMPKEGGEA